MKSGRVWKQTSRFRVIFAILPLRGCVACHTKSKQVAEIICINIAAESLVGDYMMNLQIRCGAAMLAGVVVSFLSGFTLFVPVWAAVIRIATPPCAIVRSRAIARFTLPSSLAKTVAEVVRAYFARSSIEHDPACVAWHGHGRNVLYVAFSAWRDLFLEYRLARLRAINMSLGRSAAATIHQLPAARTWQVDTGVACNVSACG